MIEVDARVVNGASIGAVTARIRERYEAVLRGADPSFAHFVTPLG